jgi:hypothetical protein
VSVVFAHLRIMDRRFRVLANYPLRADNLPQVSAEYERLLAAPGHVEKLLLAGAEKARVVSRPFIVQIRERVGIRPLGR